MHQALVLLPALIVGLLACIPSGIVGSYIVVKRIVFIAGSVSHAILGGLGIFVYIRRVYNIPWLDPLYGALLSAIFISVLIGWIHLRFRQREDTIIGALWAFGMAIGIIFMSLTPGYNTELIEYLFGNILWASRQDIILMVVLDAIIIGVSLLFHHRFVLFCFDPVESYLRGISPQRTYFILLTMVGITTVVLIKVVGAILLLSLLSLPAGVASLFAKTVDKMIFMAICIAIGCMLLGLLASYVCNLPAGATIAIVSSSIYALSMMKAKR